MRSYENAAAPFCGYAPAQPFCSNRKASLSTRLRICGFRGGRPSACGGLPGRLHWAGRGPAAAQGAAPHCSRIRGRIFETEY
jgi:hypothetical protein